MATEKRALTLRLEGLESKSHKPIDPDALLKHGLAAIRDLPRLLESGNIEERKEFVRAFVAGITVVPDKLRLDLQMRTLPAVLDPDFACELVAGARYEPLQVNLEPHLVVPLAA